jgi:protein-L-isoaspartate(D-aspartate) O-methyltransferase
MPNGAPLPPIEELERLYGEGRVDEWRRAWAAGLGSRDLIDAFARVPRERFLGPGPWRLAAFDGLGSVLPRETPDGDPRHLYHNVPVCLDPEREL